MPNHARGEAYCALTWVTTCLEQWKFKRTPIRLHPDMAVALECLFGDVGLGGSIVRYRVVPS